MQEINTLVIVKILAKIDYFDVLVDEVLFLVNNLQFEKNQIACQTSAEGIGSWTESIGSLEDLPEKEEAKYSFIHPNLSGSQIEKQIKKYSGFRSRIMILNSRKCYSVHQDLSPRIHIPIVTNEQSWMVWPKDNTCYNFKLGFSYWTDTRKFHTFLNGDSDQNRIHLVINVSNDT